VGETGSGGVEMLLRASCRGDSYDLVALVADPASGPPRELVRARAEARVVSTETAGGFVGVVWGAAVDGPGQLVLHRASRAVR
jgi:xylan 1,4-beta-xylosidase